MEESLKLSLEEGKKTLIEEIKKVTIDDGLYFTASYSKCPGEETLIKGITIDIIKDEEIENEE